MRTRRGVCNGRAEEESPRKRRRRSSSTLFCSAAAAMDEVASPEVDYFDLLPDDLVLSILSKLGAAAATPADLVSALLTCKRFSALGMHWTVLSRASASCLAVRATAWTDAANVFLYRCVDAGNMDACYLLGMIKFYCVGSRASGAALMARAAVANHAAALYSLAVIQFNGSGGTKNDRDLRAGVALCARAAKLGHVDALRELGHCLQDGYGIYRDVAEGRRLIVHANAQELASALSAAGGRYQLKRRRCINGPRNPGVSCSLLSDFGCHVTTGEGHPANVFLVDWFRGRDPAEGLRMCSHPRCGRPETRAHEFRRCSVCGVVNYCSRACQALHWKLAHKAECSPVEHWLDAHHLAAAAPAALAAAPFQ